MINSRQQRRLIGSVVADAFLRFTAIDICLRVGMRGEREREREREGGGEEKRYGWHTYLRAYALASARVFVPRNDVKVNGDASMRTVMACKKVIEGHARSRSLFDSVWDLVHLFGRPRPSGLCTTRFSRYLRAPTLIKLKRDPAGEIRLRLIQVYVERSFACFHTFLSLLTSKVRCLSESPKLYCFTLVTLCIRGNE